MRKRRHWRPHPRRQRFADLAFSDGSYRPSSCTGFPRGDERGAQSCWPHVPIPSSSPAPAARDQPGPRRLPRLAESPATSVDIPAATPSYGTLRRRAAACLIVGIAHRRHRLPWLYRWDQPGLAGSNPSTPGCRVCFKPMGAPRPEPIIHRGRRRLRGFITGLMGGFSIPPDQAAAQGKQYLLMGMRLNPRHRAHGDGRRQSSRPPNRPGWVFVARPPPRSAASPLPIGLEIIRPTSSIHRRRYY